MQELRPFSATQPNVRPAWAKGVSVLKKKKSLEQGGNHEPCIVKIGSGGLTLYKAIVTLSSLSLTTSS